MPRMPASEDFPLKTYPAARQKRGDDAGPSNADDGSAAASSLDALRPLLSATNHRYSTHVISRIKKSIAADGISVVTAEFATEDEASGAREEMQHAKELLSMLRSLPTPMEEKRQYRQELLKILPAAESHLPFNAYYKYMTVKKRTEEAVGRLNNDSSLWSSSMKVIEGRFGTGVVSYFVFLRWLLFMNIFIFVLMFIFVILPQLIGTPHSVPKNDTFTPETDFFSSDVVDHISERQSHLQSPVIQSALRQEKYPKPSSIGDDLGSLLNTFGVDGWVDAALQSSTKNYSVATRHKLVGYCDQTYKDLLNNLTSNDFLSIVKALIEGGAWMEDSVLFIGHYASDVIIGPIFYNLSAAFIIVAFILIIINLLLMTSYASIGVQEAMSGHLQEIYSLTTFCGWDFGIADVGAAQRHHGSIHQEFVSTLAEGRRKANMEKWTTKYKVKIYVIRTAVHLLTLLILVGAYYLIFFVTSVQLRAERKGIKNNIINQFLPPLTITGLNFLFPLIVYILAPFEEYSVEKGINIKFVRIVLLREASIVILLSSFYYQITCSPKDMCGKGYENCPSPICWETYVGQQLYRLTIMDLLVHIAVTFAWELPRRIVVNRWHNKFTELLGQTIFDIPSQVLALVYAQTLCWMGMFYSPLLPAIALVKVIIFFYIKKFTVLKNCIPDSKAYRASRSNAIFVVVLMLSFFITVGVMGYSISQIETSPGCSPFRWYFHMAHAIWGAIYAFSPNFYNIILFIFSPLVGFPIIVLLCLTLYYYITKRLTYSRIVKLLKVQLTLEGTDKQYLLNRVIKMKPKVADTLRGAHVSKLEQLKKGN